MRYRVLVVDRHTVIRYGIAAMLRLDPDFHVVDEACGDARTLQLITAFRPQVLILGVHNTVAPVQELIRLLGESRHSPRVLCIGDRADPYYSRAIIDAGAHGYLDSAISTQELTEAVHAVAAGHPIEPTPMHDQSGPGCPLGMRERQILIEVSKGLPNKAIARQHGISERTVGNHLQQVFHKLGVSNRVEAIMRAREFGVLPLDL